MHKEAARRAREARERRDFKRREEAYAAAIRSHDRAVQSSEDARRRVEARLAAEVVYASRLQSEAAAVSVADEEASSGGSGSDALGALLRMRSHAEAEAARLKPHMIASLWEREAAREDALRSQLLGTIASLSSDEARTRGATGRVSASETEDNADELAERGNPFARLEHELREGAAVEEALAEMHTVPGGPRNRHATAAREAGGVAVAQPEAFLELLDKLEEVKAHCEQEARGSGAARHSAVKRPSIVPADASRPSLAAARKASSAGRRRSSSRPAA